MPATCQRQLDYIFNRPVTDPAWYRQSYDEESDPFNDADSLMVFEFIEALCENPDRQLTGYSDEQIALGLEFIFNSSVSDLAGYFKTAKVPVKRKVQALRSLTTLFRDIFNPRCIPQTAAGSKEKSPRLNSICYMFWDVTPLAHWINFSNAGEITQSFMAELSESDLKEMQLPEAVLEMMRQQIAEAKKTKIKTPEEIAADVQRQYKNLDAETEAYYKAIAYVMRECLYLDNPACVESGLHGLGHLATFLPDMAVPIIDAYLNENKNQPAELIEYAKAARTGMIL